MRDDAPLQRKRGRPSAPEPAVEEEKNEVPAITPKQIAAGRALLGWSQQDLADVVGMKRFAINRIERELVESRGSTLNKIEAALRSHGVALVYADSAQGEGVRFIEPAGQRAPRVEPMKAKAEGAAE